MKNKMKKIAVAVPLITLATLCFLILPPLVEAMSAQEPVKGMSNHQWKEPSIDSSKKTVFIIADNVRTEVFDLLAPYYLFNRTEKANVFIVAEKKAPVFLWKGIFILPQFTFSEIDSMRLHADVIVLPNQSIAVGKPQHPSMVQWIKEHYTPTTLLLSVCDGAATAAATGLYDGKPITTHSTDLEKLEKQYPKPLWTKGVSVTQSGRLFSTAGVSNAVEGSLTVINELFGRETMQMVMEDIHYPFVEIKKDHVNTVVGNAIFKAMQKAVLEKNKRVGVLLQDGMNEMELAAVLDCYNRTFPSYLRTYTLSGNEVTSKYGLTLLATGENTESVEELHLLMPTASPAESILFKNTELIRYQPMHEYFLDRCLDRIEKLYGTPFRNYVKLSLDYN